MLTTAGEDETTDGEESEENEGSAVIEEHRCTRHFPSRVDVYVGTIHGTLVAEVHPDGMAPRRAAEEAT